MSDKNEHNLIHHSQERFVHPNALAEHLNVTRRQVMEMARRGIIPGHPLGIGASRNLWRFKISEVEAALAARAHAPSFSETTCLADRSARRTMRVGGPRSQRRKL